MTKPPAPQSSPEDPWRPHAWALLTRASQAMLKHAVVPSLNTVVAVVVVVVPVVALLVAPEYTIAAAKDIGNGIAGRSSNYIGEVGQPAAKIRTWGVGGGAALMNTLSADLTAFSRAAASSNQSGTYVMCEKLRTDAQALLDYGTFPDAETQGYLVSAVSDYWHAGNSCMVGIEQNRQVVFNQVGMDADGGLTWMNKANDRIRLLMPGG